jgi:hypothetical protein
MQPRTTDDTSAGRRRFPTPPAWWARLGAILERLVASSLLSGAGPRRRVHRPSQSLHADRALPEGDKETQGVDRAAVCGGQALARDAPVSDETPGEGQHRSPDNSHRAEHKAAAELWRSGTEEAGPGCGSAVPAANSGSHGPNCFEVPHSTTSALRESFFNTLAIVFGTPPCEENFHL